MTVATPVLIAMEVLFTTGSSLPPDVKLNKNLGCGCCVATTLRASVTPRHEAAIAKSFGAKFIVA